jgi:hypothetical protein
MRLRALCKPGAEGGDHGVVLQISREGYHLTHDGAAPALDPHPQPGDSAAAEGAKGGGEGGMTPDSYWTSGDPQVPQVGSDGFLRQGVEQFWFFCHFRTSEAAVSMRSSVL